MSGQAGRHGLHRLAASPVNLVTESPTPSRGGDGGSSQRSGSGLVIEQPAQHISGPPVVINRLSAAAIDFQQLHDQVRAQEETLRQLQDWLEAESRERVRNVVDVTEGLKSLSDYLGLDNEELTSAAEVVSEREVRSRKAFRQARRESRQRAAKEEVLRAEREAAQVAALREGMENWEARTAQQLMVLDLELKAEVSRRYAADSQLARRRGRSAKDDNGLRSLESSTQAPSDVSGTLCSGSLEQTRGDQDFTNACLKDLTMALVKERGDRELASEDLQAQLAACQQSIATERRERLEEDASLQRVVQSAADEVHQLRTAIETLHRDFEQQPSTSSAVQRPPFSPGGVLIGGATSSPSEHLAPKALTFEGSFFDGNSPDHVVAPSHRKELQAGLDGLEAWARRELESQALAHSAACTRLERRFDELQRHLSDEDKPRSRESWEKVVEVAAQTLPVMARAPDMVDRELGSPAMRERCGLGNLGGEVSKQAERMDALEQKLNAIRPALDDEAELHLDEDASRLKKKLQQLQDDFKRRCDEDTVGMADLDRRFQERFAEDQAVAAELRRCLEELRQHVSSDSKKLHDLLHEQAWKTGLEALRKALDQERSDREVAYADLRTQVAAVEKELSTEKDERVHTRAALPHIRQSLADQFDQRLRTIKSEQEMLGAAGEALDSRCSDLHDHFTREVACIREKAARFQQELQASFSTGLQKELCEREIADSGLKAQVASLRQELASQKEERALAHATSQRSLQNLDGQITQHAKVLDAHKNEVESTTRAFGQKLKDLQAETAKGLEAQRSALEYHRAEAKQALSSHRADAERQVHFHQCELDAHKAEADTTAKAFQQELDDFKAKFRRGLQQMEEAHETRHEELKSALDLVNDHHEKHAQNASAIEDKLRRHQQLTEVHGEKHTELKNALEAINEHHHAKHAQHASAIEEKHAELMKALETVNEHHHAKHAQHASAIEEKHRELKKALDTVDEQHHEKHVQNASVIEERHRELKKALETVNEQHHEKHAQNASVIEEFLREELKKMANDHETKHRELESVVHCANDQHYEKHAKHALDIQELHDALHRHREQSAAVSASTEEMKREKEFLEAKFFEDIGERLDALEGGMRHEASMRMDLQKVESSLTQQVQNVTEALQTFIGEHATWQKLFETDCLERVDARCNELHSMFPSNAPECEASEADDALGRLSPSRSVADDYNRGVAEPSAPSDIGSSTSFAMRHEEVASPRSDTVRSRHDILQSTRRRLFDEVSRLSEKDELAEATWHGVPVLKDIATVLDYLLSDADESEARVWSELKSMRNDLEANLQQVRLDNFAAQIKAEAVKRDAVDRTMGGHFDASACEAQVTKLAERVDQTELQSQAFESWLSQLQAALDQEVAARRDHGTQLHSRLDEVVDSVEFKAGAETKALTAISERIFAVSEAVVMEEKERSSSISHLQKLISQYAQSFESRLAANRSIEQDCAAQLQTLSTALDDADSDIRDELATCQQDIGREQQERLQQLISIRSELDSIRSHVSQELEVLRVSLKSEMGEFSVHHQWLEKRCSEIGDAISAQDTRHLEAEVRRSEDTKALVSLSEKMSLVSDTLESETEALGDRVTQWTHSVEARLEKSRRLEKECARQLHALSSAVEQADTSFRNQVELDLETKEQKTALNLDALKQNLDSEREARMSSIEALQHSLRHLEVQASHNASGHSCGSSPCSDSNANRAPVLDDSPGISNARWVAHTKAALEARLQDLAGVCRSEFRSHHNEMQTSSFKHEEAEARLGREYAELGAELSNLRQKVTEIENQIW